MDTGLLTDYKLILAYFFIAFVLIIVIFFRKVQSHALENLWRHWGYLLVQFPMKTWVFRQVLGQDLKKPFPLFLWDMLWLHQMGSIDKFIRHGRFYDQLCRKLPSQQLDLSLHQNIYIFVGMPWNHCLLLWEMVGLSHRNSLATPLQWWRWQLKEHTFWTNLMVRAQLLPNKIITDRRHVPVELV